MVFILVKLNDGFMRKTEYFMILAKNNNSSAIADHVKTTGYKIHISIGGYRYIPSPTVLFRRVLKIKIPKLK